MNLTYHLVSLLHVALSVVCIATFASRAGKAGKFGLWLWAAALAVLTLLTHQHHVLDVLAGWALGVIASKLVHSRRILNVVGKVAS